ncbi:MAG TPA: 3D domain-containing protein [Pyrinomonadaceae bacterium]|jgi:3D (Asp-Asp-Asp) domain-containing protein
MKSIIRRSAIIAFVLLTGLIVFSPKTSIAETPFFELQSQKEESKEDPAGTAGKADNSLPNTASATGNGMAEEGKPLVPALPYIATAYSLRGRTASGRMVSRGLIAADPLVLPLGSRVKLEHPGYTGEYLVADTGGSIRGRRIDIWTPSASEAMRFGRRTVKLTVLSYGARRSKQTGKG